VTHMLLRGILISSPQKNGTQNSMLIGQVCLCRVCLYRGSTVLIKDRNSSYITLVPVLFASFSRVLCLFLLGVLTRYLSHVQAAQPYNVTAVTVSIDIDIVTTLTKVKRTTSIL
jgi:hypothetical protein